MLFRTYRPGPPHSDAVEDILLCQAYSGWHEREAILPSGTVELVFNLQDDELRVHEPGREETPRRLSGAIVSSTTSPRRSRASKRKGWSFGTTW
jgi:hypothetical protein